MSYTAHQFSIDGVSFVLGLFWQPLGGAGASDRAKEIRSLAGELGFDLHVVRNSSSSSFSVGFAKSGSTLRPGIMSAAAVVSKTLEVERQARDFIFVSALPDGRWAYVAQRDGVLLSDGDQVFASEDAARACVLEHLSLGDCPLIIAPSIWGIAGTEEISFERLLPRKSNGKIKHYRWWRLLPVGKSGAVMLHSGKILVAAAVAIALAGGGIYYRQLQEKKAAEEAAAAAVAAAIAAGQPTPTAPAHPWKDKALAGDMLRACMSTLATQTLFPGNWAISEVVCSEGNLVVSWTPGPGGWVSHLKSVVPGVILATNGSAASVTAALPALMSGSDESLPAEAERVIDMYAAAQQYGVALVIAPPAPPPEVLPGQEHSVPASDWKEIGWKAEGALLPSAVLAALDGNGFRMKSMRATWQNGTFIWTMEGTQYVR